MMQCFRLRRMRWIACAWLASVSVTAQSATIRDDLTQVADTEQSFEQQAGAGGACPSDVTDPFCTFERSTSDERSYTIMDDSDASTSVCVVWIGESVADLVPANEPDSISSVQAAAGGGQAVANGFTGAASTNVSFVSLNGNRVDFGSVAASTDPQAEQSETVTIEKPLTVMGGDTIRVGLAAAAAAKVQPGSTGDAQATSRMTLQIGPCFGSGFEPEPVPALSHWALFPTTLLLAAIGYLGL